MSDSAIVLILLYGHIVSAIGLLGGSMLFGFAIGPLLPRLTPATRAELIVKLLPRIASVITGFAALLTLFGLALAYAITGGDFSQFSVSEPWGARISVGILIGIAGVALAVGAIRPVVLEVSRLQAALPDPSAGPPPARLVSLMGRLKALSMANQLLMLSAVAFMVAAAGV